MTSQKRLKMSSGEAELSNIADNRPHPTSSYEAIHHDAEVHRVQWTPSLIIYDETVSDDASNETQGPLLGATPDKDLSKRQKNKVEEDSMKPTRISERLSIKRNRLGDAEEESPLKGKAVSNTNAKQSQKSVSKIKRVQWNFKEKKCFFFSLGEIPHRPFLFGIQEFVPMDSYGKRMLRASIQKMEKEKPPDPTETINKQQLVQRWLSVPEVEDDTNTTSSEAEHSASEYQPSEQSSLSSRNSHLRPFEDSPRKRDECVALNICEDSHQSGAMSVEYPMLVEDQLHSGDVQENNRNDLPTQSQIAKESEKDSEDVQKNNRNDLPTRSQIAKAFEKVTIAGDTKIGNKRNYRKPDYCLYCKCMYGSKISNHYLHVHNNEPRVVKIAVMPYHSKERKRLLTLLQNDGNHLHNCLVLQEGYGELTVSRRPSDKESARPENYLPCVNCKAWVFKKNLSHHSKSCPAGKPIDMNFLRNSEMLVSPFINLENNDLEIDEIFSKMKETVKFPGLRDICQRDNLLKEFCRGLIHRIGPVGEQRRKDKDNVRTKIRAVARLVSKLNQKHEQNLSLDDYIHPRLFMDVVNCVKDMGLSLPNLSLTLGNYIKQICLLKKSLALQTEDQVRRKEADDFDLLFQAHWNKYVSAVCLRRLKLRSLNKTVELPLTSDLLKLKDFLDQKIDVFLRTFELSIQDWIDAAQAVMCRLILFNKRRVSEVEELKVKDLTDSVNSSDSEDILAQMDFTERALAKRMKVIEVRGKSTRGLRKVFIILSEKMNKACFHLLSTRPYVGIDPSNPYLFARCETSPLDGCQAMRVMSKRCPGLQNPERVRTRLLRKHLATTVQILDMTGDELKMVADHMGHSVSIHTDVYRLQSSLLEKTKVARALMALENGQMHKFSGRTLESCQLEELPIVEEDDDPDDGDIPDIELEDDSIDGNTAPERCTNKRPAEDHEAGTMCQNPHKKQNQIECDSTYVIAPTFQSLKKKPHTRKRWDSNEESILYRHFEEEIRNKTNPNTDKIRKVQQEYSCLKIRSLAVIKSKINNIILGKCKASISAIDN